MKTKIIFIAVFSLLFMNGLLAKNQKVLFSVNMDCEKCQKKIEKNIAFEKGVKAIDVKLDEKTVAITYDDSKTDVAKLQKGFKKIGYEAVEVKSKCCSGKSEADCCKSGENKTTECSGKCKEVK
jgi:copper chaperone CopZ